MCVVEEDLLVKISGRYKNVLVGDCVMAMCMFFLHKKSHCKKTDKIVCPVISNGMFKNNVTVHLVFAIHTFHFCFRIIADIGKVLFNSY